MYNAWGRPSGAPPHLTGQSKRTNNMEKDKETRVSELFAALKREVEETGGSLLAAAVLPAEGAGMRYVAFASGGEEPLSRALFALAEKNRCAEKAMACALVGKIAKDAGEWDASFREMVKNVTEGRL